MGYSWKENDREYYLASFNMALATFLFVGIVCVMLPISLERKLNEFLNGGGGFFYALCSAYLVWSCLCYERAKHRTCMG
jgi:hypothetical protein